MAKATVCSKEVVLLLLTCCLLLFPMWESVIVQCFVVLCNDLDGKEREREIERERERELFALTSLSSWSQVILCGSSSRCHWFVCIL